jgi:tungstate transport system ATP-binding protein
MQLQVRNLLKSYNGVPVLRHLTYSFDQGGIYVLMGPNGSGKSTFLRICALLEPPDRGAVNFLMEGKILHKDLSLKRKITLLLPKIGIFNTTVFKNVAYGLKIRGWAKDRIKYQVIQALDQVGLSHKKDHPALTLSSGEAQRLGLARAMALEPEVLILDEPTASIDAKNTGIIEAIIRNLKSQAKTMILLSTHDRSQAERLADRLMTIKEGKMVELA